MVEKRELDLALLPLEENEIEALRVFEREVRAHYPDQVNQFAIFGSKARGDSQVDSDLDILLITASDDRAIRAGIIDIASDVSVEHDVLISPRVIGEARWVSRREFLIYRQISEDAIQIG